MTIASTVKLLDSVELTSSTIQAWLRSENACVILTCAFPELVFLCTVIKKYAEKLHIPVRTAK